MKFTRNKENEIERTLENDTLSQIEQKILKTGGEIRN